MIDTTDPTVFPTTNSPALNLLLTKLKRPIPDEPRYIERLNQELEIIDQQNFSLHFERVV